MKRKGFTPEQMKKKIMALKLEDSPELFEAAEKAMKEIADTAREYCTPGMSPYYKAPYDETSTEHLREQIRSSVTREKGKLVGTVFIEESARGERFDYALPVMTGTYDYFTGADLEHTKAGWKVAGMKGMPPRPFLPDAVHDSRDRIIEALQDGVTAHIRRVAR